MICADVVEHPLLLLSLLTSPIDQISAEHNCQTPSIDYILKRLEIAGGLCSELEG